MSDEEIEELLYSALGREVVIDMLKTKLAIAVDALSLSLINMNIIDRNRNMGTRVTDTQIIIKKALKQIKEENE